MGFVRTFTDGEQIFKDLNQDDAYPYVLSENSKYIVIDNVDNANGLTVKLKTIYDGVIDIDLEPGQTFSNKISEYTEIDKEGLSTNFKILVGR